MVTVMVLNGFGLYPRQGGLVPTQHREDFGYPLVCNGNPGLESRQHLETRRSNHFSQISTDFIGTDLNTTADLKEWQMCTSETNSSQPWKFSFAL